MNREIERDHQWLADARRDALLKADAVQRELLARISQLEDAVDRVLAWADENGADGREPFFDLRRAREEPDWRFTRPSATSTRM